MSNNAKRSDMVSKPISVKAIKSINNSLKKAAQTGLLATSSIPKQTALLQYPDDVGDTHRSANYILFTAWKQIPATFKRSAGQQKAIANLQEVLNDEDLSVKEEARVRDKIKSTKEEHQAAAGAERARNTPANQSLHLANRSYSKSGTTIALYMPPSVQAQYKMQYDDAPIGVMSEAIYSIIKDIQAGVGWAEAMNKSAATMGTGAIQMGLKALDTVVPGSKDLIAMERGTIIAPRTEVMFQGIGKRNFTFNFTFIPKSRPETKTVDKIIKEFKRAMTPAFKIGRGVRELNFPEMFQIAYMHYENENEYINKIGRCFLEDATVSYGGEKFITFEPDSKGAPPNKITLALTFKEIEVMDQTKIMAGY